MRKKIISGVFALALLATAGFGVNKSVTGNGNAGLNEMALANVEALAQGEVIIGVPCMKTCSLCWCYYPPIDVDPNDYFVDNEYSKND